MPLPQPPDRSHPRLRRGTPPLDPYDALQELSDHVARYTDIKPPAPAPIQPWYDARYESPAEGHGRPRDSHYPITEPPDYTARREPIDDYGPRPGMFAERMPPRPVPPERLPTYKDTVRAGRLTEALWALPAPVADAPDSPSDAAAGAIPDQGVPTDADWDQVVEQAFADPAAEPPPGVGGLLNPESASPSEFEDPMAVADQAFDEQMRLAFSPPDPEPDPFADPLPDCGGLEQQLLEPPPMLLPDLPPFPDLPPM